MGMHTDVRNTIKPGEVYLFADLFPTASPTQANVSGVVTRANAAAIRDDNRDELYFGIYKGGPSQTKIGRCTREVAVHWHKAGEWLHGHPSQSFTKHEINPDARPIAI